MLEIKTLSVALGDLIVLDGVTLSVKAGEILAVIGPNGAGKTTLIRAISGIISARKGRIQVNGEDMIRLSIMQRARYLAVVQQAGNLPGSFTVFQAALIGRTPHMGWLGHSGPLDHDRVLMALQHTQLLSLADRRIGELSGGEQQRVLLARALAQDTPVMLLDEPTTHLDLQHQSRFFNFVRDLVRSKELAVMIVLHDLNLASLYADRMALLVGGKIMASGTPEEVLTETNLNAVYNVPVHVIPHPDYGKPLILPDGRQINE